MIQMMTSRTQRMTMTIMMISLPGMMKKKNMKMMIIKTLQRKKNSSMMTKKTDKRLKKNIVLKTLKG